MRTPFKAAWGLGRGSYLLVRAPPGLTRRGQQIDRIVVLIPSRERIRILELEPRPVVLGPPGDAEFAVVFRKLVHPPLADERNVAEDPGRSKAGKIAHDVVLQLLSLEDA